VPWLRRLADDISPQRNGCSSRPVLAGFVVDGVTLEQVSVRVLRPSVVSVISSKVHRGNTRTGD
jgi:hypothetical protein